MNYQGDYFIGLDLGTGSVGWAVTDTEYRLLKANQKSLWGIRLFDDAQTAAQTRGYRTARRRNERRKQRIQWLQQLFDAEIATVDPAFFIRLQESKFRVDDKREVEQTGRFALFNDPGFTDKEYHEKYPTIYHLRKALLTEQGPFDVRLVYLAVHHILKNRGHFLSEMDAADGVQPFRAVFENLREVLDREHEIAFDLKDPDEFEQILRDRTLKVTQKKSQLKKAAGVEKASDDEGDVALDVMVELLAGASVRLAALFRNKELKELGSIALDDKFEEQMESLTESLEEGSGLLLACKALSDWAELVAILGEDRYISLAKVRTYEKHRSDLEQLKGIVRCKLPDAYPAMFHAEGLDNYAAYCGNGEKSCSYEDFAKYTKKLLSQIKDDPEVKGILAELGSGSFLPKQTVKSNSVIPRQIHRMELVRILVNSEVYLPFLREKDATGLTVSEKILSIFDYRIPYYVGPLNRSSRFAWLERTDEKIYPWNFEQVVDLDRSAETFVRRMTAKCTYIHEDVLPKDSLLYSEFMVLNELNSLCVNGKRIPVELKKEIYRDLFLKGKKVTQKRLLDYLRARGLYNAGDSLSGIDGDFKSCLTSHRAFRNILERTGDTEMVEDLIQHIVLFGEDRKMLTRYVQKTYGDVLSPEDVRYVCKQKFSGWGRLSREFLTEIYHADRETGEAISIIEMMRDTNNNLMELLSRRFDFAQNVDAYNQEHSPMAASPREFVEKSYASPSIKRSILQAVGIVDEIVKIMGKRPPKRIFVEMAREDGEKNKRTIPRKAHLMELYEKCREEAPELFDRLSGCEESALRRDKLYLYYTQMGRCMYSGETIDLERLDSGYDIDHIYPQSKTKDDSMSNRVLVKRELNGQKGDRYPISQDIREAQRGFWKMLKERKLIDQKKFDRLTRSTPFTEDELAGFISRQLVETRQSSKLVAEILRHLYGEDRVVYVKAGNVAQFRQQADQRTDGTRTYDFVKCRSVNDLHHAKDAYLNIVVGNVYHLRFTKNPMTFLRSAEGQRYSLNRVFDYPVVRGGEVAWNPGEDGSMAVVRRTIRRNNVLFTRMAVEAGGGLFKVTILKKGKGQAAVKASDPRLSVENYGGYDKRTGAYFFLVEHTVKKKRVRSIEPVYLMHEELYRRDPYAYCEQILEPALVDPVILIPEIRINTLVSFDGFKMHVSGRTGSRIIYKNANQLILAPEWHQYIKQAEKYTERCRKAGRELPVTSQDGVSCENNCRLFDVLKEKLSSTIYHVKLDAAIKAVDGCRSNFERLSVNEQCLVLKQILNILACNASSADLKLAGGKIGIGILLTSKTLDNYSNNTFKLIHQSITGVFEQEVDLLGEISPKALRE